MVPKVSQRHLISINLINSIHYIFNRTEFEKFDIQGLWRRRRFLKLFLAKIQWFVILKNILMESVLHVVDRRKRTPQVQIFWSIF